MLHDKPEFKRRDSESLLQGLVAHVQCRDWAHVINSLLKERAVTEAGGGAHQSATGRAKLRKPHSRSIYREILFLLMVVSSRTNVGKRSPRQQLNQLMLMQINLTSN